MRNTQCAVQVVNNMAFGVEKRYLKTELFKTAGYDYSHRFGWSRLQKSPYNTIDRLGSSV
jgi:hypothetical protein